METMTSVTLPLRVPCRSTCGPPSHLPLAESASWVLKKTSCKTTPSHQRSILIYPRVLPGKVLNCCVSADHQC